MNKPQTMTQERSAAGSQLSGLLRNPRFDLTFIAAIPLLAIASGLLVTLDNDLFLPVLAADLWLIGYHHVIATYTRLAFDRQSFLENRRLIFYLLPAVAIAVVALATTGGAWVVTTVYLYWQWWHYTRQSEGISKAYAGKSKAKETGNPMIARAAFYAVPVAGILAVSHRSPANFLFLPLKTLPVPAWLVTVAIVSAAALVIMWFMEQVKAYRSGKLAIPFVAYVISHFVIYLVAYILFTTLDYGWLTINIWHNAQYILFVWLYNNRRFQGSISESHRFLSTISQNGRFILYIGTCLTISTLVYFLLAAVLSDAISSNFQLTATITGLVIYQTINFHHYIVDSLIWKLRKKPIRETLGIS
jgi:hypothetical protein